MTTVRALLAVGTEKKRGERDNLANRVCELEVDAATTDKALTIIVRPVRSLKESVVAGETLAKKVEVRACKALDKMFELHSLVERLTRTANVDRARVEELV